MSHSDDDLSAELAAALEEARDVPERRRAAAYAAFTWRTTDAEFLTLVHDSALAAGGVVRGDEPRGLSFEGGGLTLEVEVDDGHLVGQILAPHVGEVRVETPDGRVAAVRTDAFGFFSVNAEPTGPVRFSVSVDGETRRTEWVVL